MDVSNQALWTTLALKLVQVPLAGLVAAMLLGFRGPELVIILIASVGSTAMVSYPQAVALGGDDKLANQVVIFTTLFQ